MTATIPPLPADLDAVHRVIRRESIHIDRLRALRTQHGTGRDRRFQNGLVVHVDSSL